MYFKVITETEFFLSMRYVLLIFLTLFSGACNDPHLSLKELNQKLIQISNIEDKYLAKKAADNLWHTLVNNNRIPYTSDSSVIFFYKGDVERVSWNGDFNNWGSNTLIKFEGTQLGNSDIWFYKHTFPSNARLDYKININNTEWVLDPENPFQQWSGFGPNSELRMPDWQEDTIVNSSVNIPKGNISNPITMRSNSLGYDVNFWVYIPYNYESTLQHNVIYVTDGDEYINDDLGSMITVLDNLHFQGKIEPTVAVFISPLDPKNQDLNRRMDEMANNQKFISFFIGELIPRVESGYKVSKKSIDRAILGTSLGGLNATYFGFTRPDIFQKIGIQSPAYWYRDEIFDIVKASNITNTDIFMSVGTIGDNTIDARNMKNLFERKNLRFNYIEVNEGHSWGAWRSQIDDILIQFFGTH